MADLTVTFKIRRQNPEIPGKEKPYWEEFTLTDVDPTDRVLEMLHRIKWEQDGTLSLRRSCAHGVCGSDAMRINGVNALACKVLIQDVGTEIMVEPILGLPVIKDLIVDMEPFFEHYRSVMPFFVNNDPPPADGRERLQTQADKDKFDDTTKCILCAACTTSCPSFWANGKYVGPAAIVQAHRFIFDTRDQAAKERLNILAEENGVWRCRTIYNCTPACPREIQVTKAIGEVKLAIMRGSTEGVVKVAEIH
ncbi:succinate dehydrogenase iron-sulfur subunit [Phototrophicus methaneseepsis]|uniref:succinate dehydrogenase n=1 Tax=Phototrophicus methaneseepsis TaxID=2710758 RepID=A0A7S8EAT5_9CHLR|nr:succinate dehydrogenase iron-sulfur subunit [Phototrophicus methaneseepsis]QPC83540.1 succinate dehydrogenase iron-sulfur subunit [Phototrophicus methaneseepsis]